MFLRPTFIVPSVLEIPMDRLRNLGVLGFIFDLDNTLMAPHSGVVEPLIRDWLDAIQADGHRCVVLTNNKRPQYFQAAEAVLQLPTIGHARKPWRQGLRQAIELLGLEPHQTVIVGDRPLTDIWGGILAGTHTILVDPLIKDREHTIIKGLRRLERMFVLEDPR